MMNSKSCSDLRMELILMILACFLAGFSDVEADDLRLTGTEGENITITCSHSNAHGNKKYFCRGECDYSNVLITSEGPNTAKYGITDRGSDFDVTIYNLMVKDSGSYWCGVDRAGVDTYTRVDLTVHKRFSDAEAYYQRLTRTEGENITITCSHLIAHDNKKYFCRGKCTYSDVLITSNGPNTAKYGITDRGNNFDVTIYNLMVKDSGLYWCGIDRFGVDTYKRVDLTVAPKPREEKKEPEEEKNSSANMKDETVAKRNTTVDEDTKTAGVKNKTEERNVTDTPTEMEEPLLSSDAVVYLGLGLRISFGLLVSVPLLVFVVRRRRLGASSDHRTERRFGYSASDPDAVVSSVITVDEG